MDQFKKKLRVRVNVLALLILIFSLTYHFLSRYTNTGIEMPDFILGFQTGAFVGLQLVLVFFLVKYFAAIRDETRLKKLYIEENDERTAMIMQKTGAAGMTICAVAFAFATVIAGFYHELVFFTLLGATVFTAFIQGFFKIYYRFKL